MPIVDGLTSTKMIRSSEKSFPEKFLSRRAALNGRVPVFAVSASLIEKERQKYIDAGFDGWILKPIDFKRLGVLLTGIVDPDIRKSCLYESGQWERGGWFCKRQLDIFSSSTKPSATAPVQSTVPHSASMRTKEAGSDNERERLNTLDNDALQADSFPQQPGSSGNLERANE